jgi:hypothetical protein
MKSINLLSLLGIRRNCLGCGRSRSLYLSIRRAIKQTVVIIGTYYFCQLRTDFSNILLSRLTPYAEVIIGDYQCEFRRNRSSTYYIYCIRQIFEKKWEHTEAMHQPFPDFKKALDSVRREVFYNIPIETGVPLKLVKLIKMWLSIKYVRVRVDMFLIRNGMKQGDALPSLFSTLF